MLFRRSHMIFKRTLGASMRNKCFIYLMRGFVCMLNLCPMYVVNTEMIEYMEPEMNRKICKLLLNCLCSMALLSYWIASLR